MRDVGLISVTFEMDVVKLTNGELYLTADHLYYIDANLAVAKFDADLKAGDRLRVTFKKVSKGGRRG